MTHKSSPPPRNNTASWQRAMQSPWLIRNELARLLVLPIARLQFAIAGVAWPRKLRLYGLPIIQRHTQSTIHIGEDSELRSTVRSNPLGPQHPVILSTRRAGARLAIGSGFGMTGGSIVCEEAITIGQRVWVGANTTILDTDFHPLVPAHRQAAPLNGATSPVVIEDDVFIGMNCIILKGVVLGAGCVVGAGSVVTKAVPPGMIAAGNPARVVGPVGAIDAESQHPR